MKSGTNSGVQASFAAPPATVLDDLARVEQRLTAEMSSRETHLEEVARHLVGAGGKRVRPATVSLIFHAVGAAGGRRDDMVEAAVALELIHSATLLHDDIIDGGETRRGRPSALRTFGIADTLVTGDFLFSRAFALCARFEAEVIGWAANACILLTEGEIMQGRLRHNPSVTLSDYLEIIRRKTASLFEAGGRTAAHLAARGSPLVEAMANFGYHVGLAFQVSDDLLDVIGSPTETGKPRGIDLRDGNPSLPIVLALRDDPELARLFAQPHLEPVEIEAGLARIRRSGVLADVHQRVDEHVAAAHAELARLPESPYRAALTSLIDGLAQRTT